MIEKTRTGIDGQGRPRTRSCPCPLDPDADQKLSARHFSVKIKKNILCIQSGGQTGKIKSESPAHA